MTIRDEDVLPVCNFCEASYDPYDRHTCAGNNIEPRGKQAECPACAGQVFACEKHYDRNAGLIEVTTFGDEERKFIPGLTRQQIGEALDEERAHDSHPSVRLNREIAENAIRIRAALSSQVGGDHYRQMKIQPVEFIIANGIGFLAGNVIKYAARYKAKGGAEDVRKIIHYCKLILEFEYGEKS